MYFTITSKVAVYAPAEWADTLTLFHLEENMYSVVYSVKDQPQSGTSCVVHRVHRVATAAFWRTFSHEGKICPGW